MTRPALSALYLCLAWTACLQADPGHPVAVRWWGQGMVSIETYWNLHVVIDPHRPKIGYADPQIPADLVLVSHDHFDSNNVEIVGGQPDVYRALDQEGRVAEIDGVLDRRPNQPRPTWQIGTPAASPTSHAVAISTVPAWHDDQQGKVHGAAAMFMLDVDGVRIVHCGDLGQRRLTEAQLAALGKVDVLLIPVGGAYTLGGVEAAAIVRQVGPRLAIPISYKTPVLNINLEPVDPFVAALSPETKVRRTPGNTVAVRAADQSDAVDASQVVLLGYKPWLPTGKFAELFVEKEAACRAAQRVFEPLSAEQMNFRPSDGTHTPRWNAEHMMGRELLFFTRAYASRDPAFEPIDLNPAQMPPDYQAAHPDWTGAEEARQMERVAALVHRFAYVLHDAELDAEAWPGGWTLRFLLGRMIDHYGQHTANVQKKFELPDWPQ